MYHHIVSATLFMGMVLPIGGLSQISSSRISADTSLANQYFVKAEELALHAKYDSSNFYFEKAREIYENIAQRNSHSELWEKYVKCCNYIGDNYRLQDRSEDALACLNRALEMGLNKLGEHHPDVATTYDNLALTYWSLADRRSGYFAQKALTIRLRLFGENHIAVARSYYNIGRYHILNQNLGKGLEYLHKALAIQLRLIGENNPDVALTYYSLGGAYDRAGDAETALRYANRSLMIRLRLFDDNHPVIGENYNSLGNIYLSKQDYAKAREYYNKLLVVNWKFFGEYHKLTGMAYVNIGLTYVTPGDYDKTLEYFNKALVIFRKLFGENLFVVNSYRNIGTVYIDKGDYAKAEEYLKKSLQLYPKFLHDKNSAIAIAYINLGDLYFKQNLYEKALPCYQQSIIALVFDFADSNIYSNPPLNKISDDRTLLASLESKAQTLAKVFWTHSNDVKAMQMSLSTYQLASDLVDKIRNSYKEEESKLLLAEATSRIHDGAMQASLQLYRVTREPQYKLKAFSFCEKSKAAVLSQSLLGSQAKQFAGIPVPLLQKERNLRIDLGFCITELQKEKQKNENPDKQRIRRLEDQYFAYKAKHEKLIAQLEEFYPQYYDLKYKTQTASVVDLQKSLDDQTALLEYFLGDSTLFAFVVTANNFEVVTIKNDSSFKVMLSGLANSFRNITSKETYLQDAARLYRLLVKPLEPLVVNKPHWIIIPDGELYAIPFEALLTETIPASADADYRVLPYLVKRHEILYHYSATLFLQKHQEPQIDHYSGLFAGFAPVFGQERKNGDLFFADAITFAPARPDAFSYLVTRDGKTLDELAYSEQELRDIWAAFFHRGRVYLHQDASEENFKMNIKDYKYVHVATHGFINSENPKLSNLAFSQPQNHNAQEDGILYAAETYNLDLNADLLVLRACQIGTGKLVKGEGLMALTRGFLYSGAHNIIASLWKVFDQHTSMLMVELYRQILAGKTYSRALREAKLKMIANPETAGPQSWASFVLIGR